MAIEGRKLTLLGALLAVLALLVYRTVGSPQTTAGPSSGDGAAANGPAAAAPGRRGQTTVTAPEVHLQALNSERPKPGTTERNLFRFKPKAPPPMPAGGRSGSPTVSPLPPVFTPSGPPPPPPITLKFIAKLERAGKPTIAVLSDGQGTPFSGTEGAIVAGRYRILRIGVESIEMAYLDGRGRQTIRLTGS